MAKIWLLNNLNELLNLIRFLWYKTALFDVQIDKSQIALFCTFQIWDLYISICVTDTYEDEKHFHMKSIVR